MDASGTVPALGDGTATITATSKDSGVTAISEVNVKNPSLFFPDTFYLGIDQYITGYVGPNLKARKAQLVVDGTVIDTVNLFSDGSFELDSKGTITNNEAVVEIVALDETYIVLDQEKVTIKEQNYSLTVNPYTLYSGSVTVLQIIITAMSHSLSMAN